ncbi:MAG: beta-ketoacyl synthase chain length factor [Alphaproteobacteria bacterium]|nr:beta-ketoacyl synthase chain length factor [Alphaproteobacteria bacterium]
MKALVSGIAVLGAGLESWEETKAILSGTKEWQDQPLALPKAVVLPPNERRRASPLVRLALSVAQSACKAAGKSGATLDCVFASAIGDGQVAHAILSALSKPEKAVSPTQFHNSVHNAMAGYWSIGVGNHAASTSLAAGDFTFGSGLLKALLTVSQENRSVILVAVDYPFPEPLNAMRPIGAPFGVAMVLDPISHSGQGPIINVTASDETAATPLHHMDLAPLWQACPPAKALSLLASLIKPGRIVIEAGADYFLNVDICP